MTPEVKIPEISPLARIIEIKNQEIAEIMEYNERKKSPYRKWIQMNNDENARKADDWLIANSPVAYRIFKFLVENMDKYNAVICSYKVMQEKFGLGQATVARAIKLLKDHKYIQVVRTGGSNVYMINKYLYWNSWGTNYAYTEFNAKVIISASEQEKEFQEKIQLEIKKRQEVVIKGGKETDDSSKLQTLPLTQRSTCAAD